jgi:hypothetical protein
MARLTRHVLEAKKRSAPKSSRPREYSGALFGRFLAEYVNMEADPTRSKVIELFYATREADQYRNTHRVSSSKGASLHSKEFSRLVDRMNRLLRRYRWTPYLYVGEDGGWVMQRIHRGSDSFEFNCAAVHCLIELVKSGLLDHVRSCQHCAKWFYAKFKHQHSCSQKCRELHHRNSEAFRASRREYMRRYYRLKLFGNVK